MFLQLRNPNRIISRLLKVTGVRIQSLMPLNSPIKPFDVDSLGKLANITFYISILISDRTGIGRGCLMFFTGKFTVFWWFNSWSLLDSLPCFCTTRVQSCMLVKMWASLLLPSSSTSSWSLCWLAVKEFVGRLQPISFVLDCSLSPKDFFWESLLPPTSTVSFNYQYQKSFKIFYSIL